jgi:hypothetical protein
MILSEMNREWEMPSGRLCQATVADVTQYRYKLQATLKGLVGDGPFQVCVKSIDCSMRHEALLWSSNAYSHDTTY